MIDGWTHGWTGGLMCESENRVRTSSVTNDTFVAGITNLINLQSRNMFDGNMGIQHYHDDAGAPNPVKWTDGQFQCLMLANMYTLNCSMYVLAGFRWLPKHHQSVRVNVEVSGRLFVVMIARGAAPQFHN